jgi:two-component sensor histidine kinase
LANELITNALKHGFPGGLSGSVSVKLSSVDGISIWSLSVSDSGVGLPDDFESKRQGSLGLQLATGLANQLGGELRVGPGAMFSVEFSIGKSDPAGMASQAAILT